MNYLEDNLKEINIFKINPTLEEVNQMFEFTKQVLVFDQESSKKRKRREEQVKLSTMVNLVRNKLKNQ
jgi:hypothetical protein